MVFQKPNPFPKSIFDNVAYGLRIHGEEDEDYIAQVVEESLKSAAIWDEVKDKLDKSAMGLSGGQQQRLCIARTIAVSPEVILMDEPFSALDYQTRIKVSDDVFKIIKEEKKTAIMVSHDISESVSLADRVIVLSKRPATVKNVYNIEMEDKGMPSANRKNEKFNYYHNAIWKDLMDDGS